MDEESIELKAGQKIKLAYAPKDSGQKITAERIVCPHANLVGYNIFFFLFFLSSPSLHI
jgi:hypothetical protein